MSDYSYGTSKVAPRRWQVFCWKWGRERKTGNGVRFIGPEYKTQWEAVQAATSYIDRQKGKSRWAA